MIRYRNWIVGDRRHLPHVDGALPQFITFRLADSLPQHAVAGLDVSKPEGRKRVEDLLDAGHGECWLRDPRIAKILEETLLRFHGQRYVLHAWVIMPNHVHLLLTPLGDHTLARIVFSLKSYVAKQANRLLGRTGGFWLADYFDRFIRNDRHFVRVVEYIECNPVTAGLCRNRAEWPYGSAARGWLISADTAMEHEG